MSGKLVLCGTPIGNLEDASQRMLRTLTEADLVACEDTRRTRKLLTHFGIHVKELTVFNEANERREVGKLIQRIKRGHTVALVSDAGMPGLSDPGYRLVHACAQESILVEVVPGPSAAVSALAVSGLPTGRFAFEGFLPRRAAERRKRIETLISEPRTLVIYESPHRIQECLVDLAAVLGARRAAVVRELTKMFEEVQRGTLHELAEAAAAKAPRGEIVVVVEGRGKVDEDVDDAELARRAHVLMDQGADRKEALSTVARETGVPRRRVFDALVGETESD